MKLIYAFFILAISLPFSKAWGTCDLSITASNISVNWDLNFTSIAVSVTINRANSNACVYSLGFTKGSGASYSARAALNGIAPLRYQLYKDIGLTMILKDGVDVISTNEVVQGGFQAGPTPIAQTVNYYFEIPYNLATTPSLVSSGTYTDTFTMNLYETDTLPLGTPVATKNIAITATVPKMIALSLVDPGASFQEGQLTRSADFVTLNQGATASMDLRVRSNAGFSVSFSSLNNGKLKHTNPAKPSLVPYSLIVNGSTLNMSNSNLVPVIGLTGSGSTNLGGLGYPVKVVIGSILGSSVLAGAHSDAVTITAITTE